MKTRYTYSVIQFFPQLAIGECINIGLVALSDETAEVCLRTLGNHRRVHKFDSKGSFPLIIAQVDRIANQLELAAAMTRQSLEYEADLAQSGTSPAALPSCEERLNQLTTMQRGALRFTSTQWIAAESAELAVERLATKFLFEPERTHPGTKTKAHANAALRKAYKSLGLYKRDGIRVAEAAKVTLKHHRSEFDFAVMNGRALQLAQGWSFQVSNELELLEKVRAWLWSVHELRGGGGSLTVDGKSVMIDSTVDVEVVYVPPVGNTNGEALAQSLAMFKELGVTAEPVDNVDAVAGEAQKRAEAVT